MGRMFTIFQYTVLRNLRDTGNSIFQMLVFPIILIFILGMALGTAFEQQEFDPVTIGYFSEDSGPMSSHFDQFLASEEVSDILAVQALYSHQQGLDLLQSGDIIALVHLDTDFSQQVLAGAPAVINLTGNTGHPSYPLKVTIVASVLESFVQGANAVVAMAAMGAVEPEYIYAANIIQDTPISASGLLPGAMDYYAVTMMVMFVLWGALYASYGLGESYLANIGQRIKSSPIRRAEQYLGLVLANAVTVYIQALVVMAFTHFVFKVSWGDNLALILLTTLLLVFVAIGLGTMAAMVTRNLVRSANLLNVLIVVSTFIAGGFFKVALPGTIGYIQYLSPSYLAQTAIFNTIYGGPAQQTIAMLAGLLGMVAVTFAVAMVAERRAVQ